MDFYSAAEKRRTVRDFTEEPVPEAVIRRILEAGLLAPSNDHRRDWAFVLLHTAEEKENALRFVKAWAKVQGESKLQGDATPAQQMYAYAMPRQYTMLAGAPWVVLPFFKAGPGLFRPASVSSLNAFASIWCVIENLFLAAAAEGLGCSMRVPVGEEGQQVAQAVGAPEGWVLPCYIGVGHPAPAPELPQYRAAVEQKLHRGVW